MGISDRDLKKWGKRGYVTYDELNAVFPPDASGEDIESSMAILSEQNIECVEAKEDYIPKKSKSTNKKSKPGPNVTNPFTKKQRQLLGQWSRFAKEENLLEPHQRRYLYFGSKYDKWYDNLPSKLVETLNKLKEHLTEEGSQQAIILRATLNYGQILIQAKAGEDWAQGLAGDYWHFGLHADVNNEKAIPWYKLAAGQGNTEAQVRLANIYFWHTDDFPGDYKSLYKAAAAKGDDEAECMMGVLADNPSLKADWLEKSAAQGNAEAQYSLAQIFESGEGRKQDYKKALQYYELAAEQNDPMALRAMGDCYFYGVVAEEDEKKGLKYYRKAADDGDTNSKIQLGKCYYYGWGVTADFLEAVEYFQQAISDDEAQIEKEEMHLFGGECYRLLATCHLFGYGVKVNEERAVELLTTGSQLGDEESQFLLGQCYYYGWGAPKDSAEAVKFFEQVISDNEFYTIQEKIDLLADCEIGGECHGLLGACYLSGDGAEEDREKAIVLLKMGSKLGDGHAQYLLGLCYAEDGKETKAFELFKASAEQDNQVAIEELVRCYTDGIGEKKNLTAAEDWYKKLEPPSDEEGKYERAVQLERLKQKTNLHLDATNLKFHRKGNIIYLSPTRQNIEENSPNENETLAIQEEHDDPLKTGENTDENIETLIEKDENDTVEFKSTARYDLNTKMVSPILELSILKTIAGMANLFGGELVIGVGDDRKIIGLHYDYQTFNSLPQNKDGFELHVRELIKNYFSTNTVLMSFRFGKVKNKEICVIEIKPGTIPVWVEVDRKKGIGDNEKQETREVLYVRYGNRTIQKEGPDIHEHLRQHFGDFMSTDL